jgi:hypothetical protein
MELNNPYLELLKRALNNYLYLGGNIPFEQFEITSFWASGWTIPDIAQPHSLLATTKLNALHLMMSDVIRNEIPGDFIEAGIYKGGTVMLMRAFLKAVGITDRIVWAADSFEGIPLSSKYTDKDDPVDKWENRWSAGYEEVLNNFRRYDLLDDQVHFIRGYFADTLRNPPFNQLAIARFDADAYESTMDALEKIYPKISPGGYVIIDDWHLPRCRQAVVDYRKANNIEEPVHQVLGSTGTQIVHEAFWKVSRSSETGKI